VTVGELAPHIKIDTSLSGISKVISSTDTQLVAIDNDHTLKFYDFIDKQHKESEEKAK
jgi:hypothetical protein